MSSDRMHQRKFLLYKRQDKYKHAATTQGNCASAVLSVMGRFSPASMETFKQNWEANIATLPPPVSGREGIAVRFCALMRLMTLLYPSGPRTRSSDLSKHCGKFNEIFQGSDTVYLLTKVEGKQTISAIRDHVRLTDLLGREATDCDTIVYTEVKDCTEVICTVCFRMCTANELTQEQKYILSIRAGPSSF